MGEEFRPAASRPHDVHEQEVDEAQEQWVHDEPELPECGVEVLHAEIRPRQLERKMPSLPDRVEIGPEGR